ncbi:methyl jasmonate esterase 1-like [Arachis stenosperma]|uniref:methyl jasmonate esterase 1-like n=1 Tax=Arachis stenosperma TaxID=217475 RepID=UPI0025AB7DB0|nr:methyl jasmonate esterase 1-like [Arachis stenosperma]
MEKEKESNKKRRHFVLVHGACHGGWCWYKVSALLKSGGHKVTAPDMAASGIHPKKVEELASITEYVEPLMELLESLPSESEERVILVGHSFGGICISMAMEMFPKKIAAAVFLSAFMPSPDRGFLTLYQEYNQRLDSNMDSKILFDENAHNTINPNGSMIFGPQFLASKLYQLSPVEDMTLAMSLLRPTRVYGDQEMLREQTRVTRDKYGSVAKIYIVCEQDQVLKKDFQLSMIEGNPEIEVKNIAEADHMPMFSKPQELFSYLHHIANTFY